MNAGATKEELMQHYGLSDVGYEKLIAGWELKEIMSNNVELRNETIKKLDAIIDLYEKQTGQENWRSRMVSALIRNKYYDLRTKGLVE